MNIGIIGLGLIGGSLAKDIKAKGISDIIYGVEVDDLHIEQALSIGLVNEVVSMKEAIQKSDILVLATPVNVSVSLLPRILDEISSNVVVIDIGSTKNEICKSVAGHLNRKQFVAAHPIAGTEKHGPLAAINNLFDSKMCLICESEKSDSASILIAKKLFTRLNMHVIELSAKEHDLHLAYVSHLSHAISFALSVCVLEIEKDEEKMLELAGSGFASTVRLAKSPAEMWAPIFEQNSENVLTALDSYLGKLNIFRNLIAANNYNDLRSFILNANEIEKILKN